MSSLLITRNVRRPRQRLVSHPTTLAVPHLAHSCPFRTTHDDSSEAGIACGHAGSRYLTKLTLPTADTDPSPLTPEPEPPPPTNDMSAPQQTSDRQTRSQAAAAQQGGQQQGGQHHGHHHGGHHAAAGQQTQGEIAPGTGTNHHHHHGEGHTPGSHLDHKDGK